MRASIFWTFVILLGGLGLLAGCHDNSPPPSRVPVPDADSDAVVEHDPVKPLPPQYAYARSERADQLPPRRIEEVPAATRAPDAGTVPAPSKAYTDEYVRVGRPRIVTFVNRPAASALLPANGEAEPTVPTASNDNDGIRPADLAAIELAVTDYLSAGGEVDAVTLRPKLSDLQVQDVEQGHPSVMTEIAKQGDVLVQIRRSGNLQLAGEALNTRGGSLLGRTSVDVPSPHDRAAIERATRELARQLSENMAATWAKYPSAPAKSAEPATAPTTAP